MTPESTLAPAQRIAWIDVARGIAITLVVHHFISGVFTLPSPIDRFAKRRVQVDRLGAGRGH